MILPANAALASPADKDALLAYAHARAASSEGASEQAARAYAAALATSPANAVLASRTFGEALDAGNRELALSAAKKLEAQGKLDPDVRLFLLGEALRTGKWKRVSADIDAIEKDEVFGFMAPILRAWTAIGTVMGEPVALLAAAQANPLAASYAVEHRPLLLLASGQLEAGTAEIGKLAEGSGMHGQRLRIAGAALLARKGERQAALDLLSGDEPALASARALLEAGRSIPGEVATPRAGVAEFLIRVAVDLHRQDVEPLALRFARMTTFLAPENSETWLVTSSLLDDQPQAALAALRQIPESDPFAEAAAAARIGLLVASGQKATALAEAETSAHNRGAASDWVRLGELYSDLDRNQDAADAFSRALALPAKDGGHPEWALQLLRGGALDQAGHWSEAKAALERAYELAPEQPLVLNYLGYAQLERRENIEQAMALIARASKLQPDSAEITDSLGWAYFLRGNLPAAIELLERAAEGQPADPAINEHLGDAYYQAGRRYEARYAWRAALVSADEQASTRLRAKIEAGLKPELASP